jgi:hypothetical protein
MISLVNKELLLPKTEISKINADSISNNMITIDINDPWTRTAIVNILVILLIIFIPCAIYYFRDEIQNNSYESHDLYEPRELTNNTNNRILPYNFLSIGS